MPEGDTIHRTAATLARVLVGHRVTRFDCVFPSVTRVHEDHPIVGRRVDVVEAQGKHLLMVFAAPATAAGGAKEQRPISLRTHMRMSGSWHVYRPGERWQRAASRMRVRIETEGFVAVAFDVHDVECVVVGAEPAARTFPAVRRLGPDLLAPSFDEDAAVRFVQASSHATLAETLLDQHLVSGIGNVLKSEVLFLSRRSPFTAPARLDASAWRDVLRCARHVMRRNVAVTIAGAGGRGRAGRVTTGRLDPSAALWVYGRTGRPCRVCGAVIAGRRLEPGGRSTFWCPMCQPET